jgi:transcriptional regulator with XRE-family HTH domain
MRAIIARGIIRDRVAAGLSQAGLARRAGIEPATLNRIERAKVTPDEATIRKIDKAIKQAMRNRPTQEIIDLPAPAQRVEKAGRLRSATRHKKAG